MAASICRGIAAGAFTSRINAVPRLCAAAPRLHNPRPFVVSTSPVLGGSVSSSLFRPVPVRSRGALVVVANAKKSLGCTKQGTRRARRRTSGFRTRMASPTGRKVLKLRRKRGRKNLCPASQRSSAGKKQ